MNIKLNQDQYYYALYLAQSELIERKNQQGSLTEDAQKLYDAFELELDRLVPDRSAMFISYIHRPHHLVWGPLRTIHLRVMI